MADETFHNFLKIWVGQLFSIIGSTVVQFTIIWYITFTYQNPVLLSIMAFIGFGPQIIFSPIAGIIVDRYNRKLIMIIADATQACVTFGLIVAFWTDFTPIWLFYIISGLRGLCQTFHTPVVACLFQTMVSPENYARINGLSGFMTGLMHMLGPVIGSFLLAIWNIEFVLWIDIITFGIAVVPLLIFSIPPVKVSEEKKKQSFKASFSEGFQIIQRIPGIIPFLILVLIINFLLMPFHTLLPFFIKVTHSGTATELASVMAAVQGGTITGALIVFGTKKWRSIKKTLLILISAIFLGYLIITLSPYRAFWLMMIGGIVIGLCVSMINPLFQTVYQLVIPPEYFGRVMAIDQILCAFAVPFGMIISGPIANWIGIIPEFLITAIIGIFSPIVAAFLPSMKKANFEQQATSSIEGSKENI